MQSTSYADVAAILYPRWCFYPPFRARNEGPWKRSFSLRKNRTLKEWEVLLLYCTICVNIQKYREKNNKKSKSKYSNIYDKGELVRHSADRHFKSPDSSEVCGGSNVLLEGHAGDMKWSGRGEILESG